VKRILILALLILSAWMILETQRGLYVVTFRDFARLYQAEKRMGMIPPDMDIRSWLKKELSGYGIGALKQINPRIIAARGEMKRLLARLLKQSKSEEQELAIVIPEDKLLQDKLIYKFPKGRFYLALQVEKGKGYLFEVFPYTSSSALYTKIIEGENLIHPYRIWGWALLALILILYRFWPERKIPENAACYSRVRAVILPDFIAFSIWWLLSLFISHVLTIGDSRDAIPTAALAVIALLFSAFTFFTLYFTWRYEHSWYLVDGSKFRWHGGEVDLEEISSVCTYERPQVPRWLGWIIRLFSQSRPSALGTAMLASSAPPEYGIEIELRDGRKIPIIFNALRHRKPLEELTRLFPCKTQPEEKQ